MSVPEMDVYHFDLLGYVRMEGALNADEVAALNGCIDAIPPLEPGQWYGYVHGHRFEPNDGINYQQIYEAGEPFEALIDHPAWIEHVKLFVGGAGTFDYMQGPLFIDEVFANLRGPGNAIGMHSGADCHIKRNQYRYRNGNFMVCQVNVLIALTDIKPGDGGTVIIPASHKQNLAHPLMGKHIMGSEFCSGDAMPLSEEIFMKAGDAIVFADTICHGSARRVNEGQRRIVVQRYGPSWGFFRHGYRPSKELLERLTPERRQIVWPHDVLAREPNLKDDIPPADA